MNPFVERHRDKIAGVLSCFDRVVITGTLPDIGYAGAMAGYLSYHKIRLFDDPRWAEPLRDELRDHAKQLAFDAGIEIEFIRRHKAFRKEDRVKAIINARGDRPGLVHIFSAMGACTAYRPWHDKEKGHTTLKPTSGKCLHDYCYFIDESFGLCYIRVPTRAPFRLQVYFNGHHWLARRRVKAGISFEMADNAFLSIADPKRAQTLADRLDAKQLHQRLNRWAKQFCPVHQRFHSGYHGSFMPVEFATAVVFHQQAEFQPLYEAIIRTAVQAIKADNVATFLGRKLTTAYQGEVGHDFSTRIQVTRIRHPMGPTRIKLYDKAGIMARVECTTHDASFFKIHRWVEQRDGGHAWKLAPLRKNIYSLRDLRKLMHAANHRYLASMAAIDNPDAGLKDIDKMSGPAKAQGRSFRGFNLFQEPDDRRFLTLGRGEWSISGVRAADLRATMPDLSPSQSSYLLKRLRTHGLIKQVGRRDTYYLTTFGRRVLAASLKIREYFVLPALCADTV
jgi:hypothetical protein